MRGITSALIIVLLGAIFAGPGSAQQETQPVPEGIIIQPQENQFFVKITSDRPVYSPKDRLQISVDLSHDAYVYIYDINADGKVTLLFPNGFSKNNFLKAGKHTLPPTADYSFIISKPLGAERLQALALLKPIPLLDVTPQKDMDVFVFPQLSTEPKELKPKVEEMINVTVEPGDWAADWTQFLIADAISTLSITSNPVGVQVFVNNQFVGVSPLKFSINSGRVTINLVQQGYENWTQQIELGNFESRELHVELSPLAQESVPYQPDFPGDGSQLPPDLISSFQFGFDVGLSNMGQISTGFDVGFSSGIGIGASITFSEDAIPEYFDIGTRVRFSDERVYNLGPEMEAYLKLILPIRSPLFLIFGGGAAIQEQVHVATPATLAGASSQAVTVVPNGYRDTISYLTGFGGIGLQFGSGILELGHHNRRGWILGLTIRF